MLGWDPEDLVRRSPIEIARGVIYAREEIEARNHRDAALGRAVRQLERLIDITKVGLNVEEKDAPELRSGRGKPSLEERVRLLAERRQQQST